jgi:hypothetical protein
MSTREVILTGYAVLAVIAVALTLRSLRPGHAPYGPAACLATVMNSRAGRWLLLLGWLWLGWHLFVR